MHFPRCKVLWRGFLFIFAGMKARLFVVGMLLLLCAACHTPTREAQRATSQQELSAIDSLMWRQPDSALAVLMKYLSDEGRDAARYASTDETFDNHFAQLLASELLYKNDYEQTNRLELQRAVGYFDSLLVMADIRHASTKTTAFLDARAHYINGVGYYERDSVVEACKEYLKALEIMEGHFEEKEMVGKKAKFVALTYTHLTDLFSDLYLHEQALCFGKLSLKYHQKYDATLWHLAWVIDEIGLQYDMMSFYDSACFYYKKGIEILTDTGNLVYRDLAAHQTFLSYEIEKEPNIAVNRLHQLLVLSDSKKEYLSRCLTIGEIFFHEVQFDSAFVYLNEVYNYSESIDSKKQAAEWLVEICKAQERSAEIMEYADFLVPFANVNENSSFLKSQLTELCNTYEQGRQKSMLQHKQKETLRKSVFITMGIVLVGLVGFIIYLFINMRQRETERHAHRMQQAALSGRLKKSNEALRDTSKQLEKAITEKTAFEQKASVKDYSSFRDSLICRQILEMVENQYIKSKMDCSIYKEFALSKEQLQSLRDSADEYMGQFTTRIRNRFPKLTDEDMNYCCLYMLGLNDAEVSALMQRAYPTVCERNRKIRRIIGEKNNLSFAIRNL